MLKMYYYYDYYYYYYSYYYSYYQDPRKLGDRIQNFQKNKKIIEHFPVAPGRPLGYPVRPTSFFWDFSKMFRI